MAQLVVTGGPLQGQRFDLAKETTRIGRRAGNDWVLDVPSVSSTHCEIVRVDASYLLRDLGSTNGTRLNGERIQEARLHRNDVITLGDETLLIDGEELPVAADEEDGDGPLAIPRTTVLIRPQTAPHARLAPPPDFRRRTDIRRLWIVVIVLLGLAVLIAAFVFLRSELAGR